MNGISVLMKEAPQSLPPREDAGRGRSSMTREAGFHQTPTCCSQLSLQNCEKSMHKVATAV